MITTSFALYACLSARKRVNIHAKCHRETYFFVHSLAVLKNAALSFFNCFMG